MEARPAPIVVAVVTVTLVTLMAGCGQQPSTPTSKVMHPRSISTKATAPARLSLWWSTSEDPMNVPNAARLSFPQPVRSAFSFLQTKTDRLLAGPTVLNAGGPLSAQVSVDRKGGYQVN